MYFDAWSCVIFDMDPVAKAIRGERGDSGFKTDAGGVFKQLELLFHSIRTNSDASQRGRLFRFQDLSCFEKQTGHTRF